MPSRKSVFTEAVQSVMGDIEVLKDSANNGSAPTFMHEAGVPSGTRKKRFEDMTEFERLMEIQNNGQQSVLNEVGYGGATEQQLGSL